jgi:hypothetical protein
LDKTSTRGIFLFYSKPQSETGSFLEEMGKGEFKTAADGKNRSISAGFFFGLPRFPHKKRPSVLLVHTFFSHFQTNFTCSTEEGGSISPVVFPIFKNVKLVSPSLLLLFGGCGRRKKEENTN